MFCVRAPLCLCAAVGTLLRAGLALLLAKLCQHMQLHSVPWASQALANSALTTSADGTPQAAPEHFMHTRAGGGLGGRVLGQTGSSGRGGGLGSLGVGFGSSGAKGVHGYSPSSEGGLPGGMPSSPVFQPTEVG